MKLIKIKMVSIFNKLTHNKWWQQNYLTKRMMILHHGWWIQNSFADLKELDSWKVQHHDLDWFNNLISFLVGMSFYSNT